MAPIRLGLSRWLIIVFVFFVFVFFGFVFWRYARFDTTSNGKPPHPSPVDLLGFPGGHQYLHHAEGRQGRGIILLMAGAVFLSFMVGFWFAQAQTKVERYSHRAFESQIAFIKGDSENRLIVLEGGLQWASNSSGTASSARLPTQRAVLELTQRKSVRSKSMRYLEERNL